MKKITLLLSTLVFSLTVFSSSSFAEWTKVDENVKGTVFYVDFERIRKHDGYVYWWDVGDYLKPSNQGNLSLKIYRQGDCKFFRFKYLSGSSHKKPMGEGTGETFTPRDKWVYPSPDSMDETILKRVCAYAD